MPASTPLCVAHRGGPGANSKLENTLTAISASLDLGVKAIEIDVWLVDGELVVFHDRRLGRFFDRDDLLEQTPLELLKAPDMQRQLAIPTLEEIIDLVSGRAVINIEIKGPECAEAICNLIQSRVASGRNHYNQFILSSFDQPQIKQCLQILPQVRRGLLICGVPMDLAQQAENLRCYFLGFSLEFIAKTLIEDCHLRGINAWVYTANHPEDIQWLSDLGVDALFTDYPERMLAK